MRPLRLFCGRSYIDMLFMPLMRKSSRALMPLAEVGVRFGVPEAAEEWP
jgi:hypothetical protein